MSTITEAPKPLLRYSELENWLRENGVSERKMNTLISQKIIKPRRCGGGIAYYSAREVKRDVLNKLDGLEEN